MIDAGGHSRLDLVTSPAGNRVAVNGQPTEHTVDGAKATSNGSGSLSTASAGEGDKIHGRVPTASRSSHREHRNVASSQVTPGLVGHNDRTQRRGSAGRPSPLDGTKAVSNIDERDEHGRRRNTGNVAVRGNAGREGTKSTRGDGESRSRPQGHAASRDEESKSVVRNTPPENMVRKCKGDASSASTRTASRRKSSAGAATGAPGLHSSSRQEHGSQPIKSLVSTENHRKQDASLEQHEDNGGLKSNTSASCLRNRVSSHTESNGSNGKVSHASLSGGYEAPPGGVTTGGEKKGNPLDRCDAESGDTRDADTGVQDEDFSDSSSEDEEFNPSVKTDRFGFFVTSERTGLDVAPKTARARRRKEQMRANKWRKMIENFDKWRNGRNASRFRRRVRKGVPDCVRGMVWQMISGSEERMKREPTKYADLVASDIPVEGPIEEDLPRTMYDHELFCRKSRVDGRGMLRRVLTAYGRYDREVTVAVHNILSFSRGTKGLVGLERKLQQYHHSSTTRILEEMASRQKSDESVAQVQYCQGINYICALFLLYMPEENAFWLLVASMQRPRSPLRELFLPGMVKAQEVQYVVDSLTSKHCPKLSAKILANNLTPAMYATQWFLTAFTQRFPYELVTRVWDMFLLEDWKVFYRVCLALFKSVEEETAHLDLENMNLLLRNLPPKADANKILNIAASIPLKHRHIEKRIARFHSDRNV